jgi:hypothetical protein
MCSGIAAVHYLAGAWSRKGGLLPKTYVMKTFRIR